MNKLVFLENNRPVTDSLTVAETFGKSHDNVMRDIRQQIEKLNEAGMQSWGFLNFEETKYQHTQNKQWYPKYNMTEDAFAIVAMSYVTPESMKMKVQFLEEFRRMREQLSKLHIRQQDSYMIDDRVERAKRWIEEEQERKMLITDNEEKEKLINELKPKASYCELVLQSKSLVSTTIVAKDYGMSAQAMNKLLHDYGIQYKSGDCWVLYQKYADKGYTATKTQVLDEEKSKTHTYWTQKGRMFIYDFLKEKGIIPIIEQAA